MTKKNDLDEALRGLESTPPAPPVKLGPPRPDLKSSPLHEPTYTGSPAPPSAGSYAPDSRELVLPEWEPPTNARRAKEEAHRHGDRVVQAPQSVGPVSSKPGGKDEPISPEVLASVKLLRKGAGALGKWLAGIVAAALLGGGGAVVGSQAAPQVPPGVLECPAQIEAIRAENKRLVERVDRLESRDDAALERWRRTDEKTENALGKLNQLETRVLKVNP